MKNLKKYADFFYAAGFIGLVLIYLSLAQAEDEITRLERANSRLDEGFFEAAKELEAKDAEIEALKKEKDEQKISA